ncbi:MAG: glycosyltransferase [Lachnospiraceae bacterium]|nr:glycosyltransferase [Lachnospiraceae bacterium]
MKKALVIATVSGFLMKFEMQDVRILQNLGYEVHYAANCDVPKYEFDPEELARSGVRLHSIPIEKSPLRLRRNSRAIRMTEALIREEQIRLIHCHTPVGGVVGRLAGRRCRDMGIRVIYTAHGFHFYRGCPLKDLLIYRTAEKLLARDTDALVVINQEDYESASGFRLKENGRVYRIPGVGLDPEKFHPFSDEHRREVRKRLGVREAQILFLSVGEINKNKNHITILKALERMRDEGGDMSRYRYLVFGDGPERETLEYWTGQHGLRRTVSFPGYCNAPEEMYGAADLFFFPSRREGLGMAALEALACGVPVAAADNRGSGEYILPGENGWLCRWDAPEDYISAFRQWERLSPAEKYAMREKCRDSVAGFDKKYAARVMEQVYTEL